MNPQTQLFQMLAESNLRHQHITQLHKSHISKIPQKQQGMQQELEQLRQQIQSAGIGQSVEAEDRYMELLEHAQYLDQSWDMHSVNSRKFPEEPEEEDASEEESLQKAVAYGQMLKSVYGGGALIKGAGADLEHWGRFLLSIDPTLGRDLLKLAGVSE